MLLLNVSDINQCKLSLVIVLSDGEDYRRDSTIVNMPAGKMSKTFAINIINDNTVECNETFILILSVPTLPCEVVSGSDNATKVIIRDSDSKKIVSD